MKEQALTELRRLYQLKLRSEKEERKYFDNTYNSLRAFCLNCDILSFQEIETMETEQNDLNIF